MNNVIKHFRKCYKYSKGGIVFAKGGWEVAGKNTNRYNKANDTYLDEMEEEAYNYGFNDLQLAAMIANAIHENQGSPLTTTSNGRVGFWQGDKRQAAYMGNTTASNMKAFKQDYDHGGWYSTYDKNGWNPKYHKLFKDGDNIEDVTYGMIAGYERFGGSNNRNNTEVISRIKTAKLIYDLLVANKNKNNTKKDQTLLEKVNDTTNNVDQNQAQNIPQSIAMFGQSPLAVK